MHTHVHHEITFRSHICSGNALITNGMATVTINGLECGVTYTIIAGGTLDGDFTGPESSQGNIMETCVSSARGGNEDNRGNYLAMFAGISLMLGFNEPKSRNIITKLTCEKRGQFETLTRVN